MKSFEDASEEKSKTNIAVPIDTTKEDWYYLGAEEKLKSLKCETCIHYQLHAGLDGEWVECLKNNKEIKMPYGCIYHKAKEEV